MQQSHLRLAKEPRFYLGVERNLTCDCLHFFSIRRASFVYQLRGVLSVTSNTEPIMKRHLRQLPKRGLIVACHIVPLHWSSGKNEIEKEANKFGEGGKRGKSPTARERLLFVIDRDVHVM